VTDAGLSPPVSDAVMWHDLECGSYVADLPLWRELAAAAAGPVLDLGAGTGRVTLDLAERGHDLTAVDSDGELLEELGERAGAAGLEVRRLHSDARSLPPGPGFSLVLAPMQFLQIMDGREGRRRLLQRVAARLLPGGVFAAAVTDLEEVIPPTDAVPPLPDVAETGSWVFSSIPLDVRPHPDGVMVEWLRQRVSPAGELGEQRHSQLLEALSPSQLEREASEHGLRAEGRRELAPTRDHVGSTVVTCRR
jgi:SAM-dependent methyltransferase